MQGLDDLTAEARRKEKKRTLCVLCASAVSGLDLTAEDTQGRVRKKNPHRGDSPR